MTTIPFIDGWTVRRASETEATPVLLPHDAMISEPRSANSPSGSHGAYFPGGRYVYAKTWAVPADGLQRSLVFEGVYGETEIRINNEVVGTSISGYREFSVPLPSAGPARIEVEVDNSHLPNSRWYTGSGIYRPVWLREVAAQHILPDGLRFTTTSVDGPAVVEVAVDVENADAAALTATVTLTDADGTAVSESVPMTSRGELTVTVPQPRLWSAEAPHLYRAVVTLQSGTNIVDTRSVNVGLRTVSVDAQHGLRVNGAEVLLRGACVHHDSGVLGAATLRASEFRRARILKESGFNAIRSSHNPLSRDLIDACDELGLYVLDELTDVWFAPKSAHDVAPHFDTIWRDDARSMVAKDRNHPSVIMYSIGNEIAESGSERGIETAQAISDFVRELDPTRPTTLALNFLLNVMAASGKSLFDTREHDVERVEKKASAVTSTMANIMANRIGGMMQTISKLPKADKVSRDTFKAVDVAGYNYAWGRYRGDARRHPDRVVLGSESMPGDLPKIWPLVQKLPNVIGDFLWTGWDYLGETGIGTWSYGAEPAGLGKAYPELVAGCGLIDITGVPGGAVLLAQATWGLLEAPQIAVHPVDRSGAAVHPVAWRSTDAIQSWSWKGCEGRRADIDVYSTDEQVELLLNGRSLGRKTVGARFVATFKAAYEPGELVAIGYRGGVEVSRSSLRSAGAPTITAVVEEGGDDAVFVRLELADENGVIEMLADDEVTVSVSGAGVLAGLGSAAPATVESFVDASHSTFYGRALAVVRPTGDGPITMTVTSSRHGSTSVVL